MKDEKFTIGSVIKGSYYTGVYARCGWRQRYVEALLEVVSPGMAVIKKITYIEEPGSKRQQYYVAGVISREIGKRKIISCLRNVEVVNNGDPKEDCK